MQLEAWFDLSRVNSSVFLARSRIDRSWPLGPRSGESLRIHRASCKRSQVELMPSRRTAKFMRVRNAETTQLHGRKKRVHVEAATHQQTSDSRHENTTHSMQ